jgi:hypothetical protein
MLEFIDEKPFCCCWVVTDDVIVEDNNVTWLDSSIEEHSDGELFKEILFFILIK